MFSPSKFNKDIRNINFSLFLEHLQENGFEYILPIYKLNDRVHHIFWYESKGILCGVESYNDELNECYMIFELTAPDYIYIYGSPNLYSGSPEIDGVYPVGGKWDPRSIQSTSTFDEWIESWGNDSVFQPIWKYNNHYLWPILGLEYLEPKERKEAIIKLVNKMPQKVKNAIASAIPKL